MMVGYLKCEIEKSRQLGEIQQKKTAHLSTVYSQGRSLASPLILE